MQNNQEELDRIAGTVLGKTADGKTMQRYKTPENYDPELLVSVPRYLNRETYDLNSESIPMFGFDLWKAYEVSFLSQTGRPINGIYQFVVPADSDNIVESKSVKLFFNSFNMVKVPNTKIFEYRVNKSILDKVNVPGVVSGSFFSANENIKTGFLLNQPISGRQNNDGTQERTKQFINIDTVAPDMIFSDKTENPGLLKYSDKLVVLKDKFDYIRLHSSMLRSNCRVTNQPDFGDVFISYMPCWVPESDSHGAYGIVDEASLIAYIASFRNESHFHEEVCEMIYKRLYDFLQPEELLVACQYTRRGGIDINPVRASSMNFLRSNCRRPVYTCQTPATKLVRQ